MGKVNKRNLMIIIGLAFLLSPAVILYAIFIESFFNDFKAVLEINVYGEAYVEFVFMPITILVGIWAVLQVIKKLKQETKKCTN